MSWIIPNVSHLLEPPVGDVTRISVWSAPIRSGKRRIVKKRVNGIRNGDFKRVVVPLSFFEFMKNHPPLYGGYLVCVSGRTHFFRWQLGVKL